MLSTTDLQLTKGGEEDTEIEQNFSKRFGEGDEMRFRNALIEIVEELRMRREHDVETEDYVKKLLDAKGTLEHDLELERRKSDNLQDKLFKQEGEIRRKFETQLTVLEEEKRKAEAKNVYEESEIKGLRDEIKKLHMDKFDLERTCKEQDRKLLMVNSSRDSIMSQTTQLGQKCAALKKELETVTHQVDHLQTCVKAAEELCCKLTYANSHQECQLEQSKKELEQVKKKLLDAQVAAKTKLSPSEDEASCMKKLKVSEQEIKMVKDLNMKLEHRIGEMRKEHSRLVDALSNAHSLVGTHVEGNTQLNDRISVLEKEVEDVKEREMTTCLLLQEAEKHVEDLKEKLNMKDGDWEARLQDAEEKLVVCKEEVGKMKRDRCLLAERNDQLCELNSRLEASVKNAQEERLVMKESLESTSHQVLLYQRQIEEKKNEWELERNSLLKELEEQKVVSLKENVDEDLQAIHPGQQHVTDSSTPVDSNPSLSAPVPELTSISPNVLQSSPLVHASAPKLPLLSPGVPQSPPLSPLVPEPPSLSPMLILTPVQQEQEVSVNKSLEEEPLVAEPEEDGLLPGNTVLSQKISSPSQQIDANSLNLACSNNEKCNTTIHLASAEDHAVLDEEPSVNPLTSTDGPSGMPTVGDDADCCSSAHLSSLPSKRQSEGELRQEGDKRLKCDSLHPSQDIDGEECCNQTSVREAGEGKPGGDTLLLSQCTQDGRGDLSPLDQTHVTPRFVAPEMHSNTYPGVITQKAVSSSECSEIPLDSDEDLITSSIAHSISAVQQFLRRDRLRVAKGPSLK